MADRILIIDDEEDIRGLLTDILKDEGYDVFQSAHSMQAEHMLKKEQGNYDLVILDIWLENSEKDGIEILKGIKKTYPDLPVLMISGHGSIDTAVQTIKLGAYEFIEKPFKTERMLLTVKRAIESARLHKENLALKREKTGQATLSDLTGDSTPIQNLRKLIDKVAHTDSRILISGETGTGKGLVAKIIHSKSKRAEAPYKTINCSVLTQEDIEDVLFGKEEGGNKSKGLLEKAAGGTIFIEEISDISLNSQAKLLKMVQKQESESQDDDVRIIASSSADLRDLIQKNLFREDLYYRLNVVPIQMPSLRERKEDFEVLSKQMIAHISATTQIPTIKLGKDILSLSQIYEWPGNIREFRNVLEWIMIMMADKRKKEASLGDLPENMPGWMREKTSGLNVVSSSNTDDYQNSFELTLKDARENFERQYLNHQIERFQGNISKTANFIGMERTALHRKLKTLGLSYGEEAANDG